MKTCVALARAPAQDCCSRMPPHVSTGIWISVRPKRRVGHFDISADLELLGLLELLVLLEHRRLSWWLSGVLAELCVGSVWGRLRCSPVPRYCTSVPGRYSAQYTGTRYPDE